MKFDLELVGDLDYEEMVVDVNYMQGNVCRTVAMVTMEKGVENMEVQIIAKTPHFLPLDDLLRALMNAKQLLIDTQKMPDDEE